MDVLLLCFSNKGRRLTFKGQYQRYFSIHPVGKLLKIQTKWNNQHITKTCIFKHIGNFTTEKENFPKKEIFHISAQNIDYGYSLEPPRRSGSNKYHNLYFRKVRKIMYTPVNPSFTIQKVGLKGVKTVKA